MIKVWIILLIFGFTLNSQAQLVNIESQRVQSDSVRTITVLDLLYNYQNNNNEELSLINFSATHFHNISTTKF